MELQFHPIVSQPWTHPHLLAQGALGHAGASAPLTVGLLVQQAPMAASARLRYEKVRTAEKCRGQKCRDKGELALVHRSWYDRCDWWRCPECKAFHMTPEQEKKEGLWWGGPQPPIKAHKWVAPGNPHATIDEQGFRAEQGLRVYSIDASTWLYGPTTGRRLAELGLNHAEAFVMSQVQDRFNAFGQARLASQGVQRVWPKSISWRKYWIVECIRREYRESPGVQESGRVTATPSAARVALRSRSLG